MQRPRLYLAGPEVFRPDAVAEGRRLKRIAAELGAEGVYPLDGGELHSAGAIKQRCTEMIDAADAVVANISPFRGHHMDPGTAFEIGYAEARGKKVFLWSSEPGALLLRIPAEPAGSEARVEWRDADGHLVEDFDLAENLMITAGQGRVWPGPGEAIETAIAELRAEEVNRAAARRGRRLMLLIALAALALALITTLGRARADIFVIDGDTIVVDREHIRLVGMDAPETRNARCEAERRLGYLAKARLAALLSAACGELARAPATCLALDRQSRKDRYGRSLARLSVGGRDVAATLIAEGVADSYICTGAGAATHCPRRRDWCGRAT